jgi:hypothetical protein
VSCRHSSSLPGTRNIPWFAQCVRRLPLGWSLAAVRGLTALRSAISPGREALTSPFTVSKPSDSVPHRRSPQVEDRSITPHTNPGQTLRMAPHRGPSRAPDIRVGDLPAEHGWWSRYVGLERAVDYNSSPDMWRGHGRLSSRISSGFEEVVDRSEASYWAVPTLGDGECYGCPPTARLRGWSVCDLGSYPTLQPLIRARLAATSAALLTTSR